jgi:hypothetical protein
MEQAEYLDALIDRPDDFAEGAPQPARKFLAVLVVGAKKNRAELEAAYGGVHAIPQIVFEDEDQTPTWEQNP